jgi:hypothetical protein
MSVGHTDFSLIPKFLRRADNKNSSALSPKPTPKLIDGVPENLHYAFSRKFTYDVHRFQHRGQYNYYGILTRGGNKFYFQMQSLLKGLLTIKLCPTDTTSRVLFSNEHPNNIKNWTTEILTPDDQTKLSVFYIKNPNDYFETFTLKQNIWPMDTVPAQQVSLSQSFSNERNPYFI